MKIEDIIKMSRPRFWMYLAGTYLIGYVLGIQTLNELLSFDFWLLFVAFLIPANIFLYGVNDYHDEDTDKYNLKKRSKEYLIQKKHKRKLKFILAITFILTLIPAILAGTRIIYLMLIFFFLSYYYSAPPLRFKAKPFIDSSSNFLYVMPGIIGFAQNNTNISWILLIGLFCWTAAMHLYSAIPDILADKKAKLKTTATTLGEMKSLILCLVLWSVFSATIIYHNTFLGILSFVYPLLIILILTNNWNIEKTYWYYPYINAVSGFIAFVYLALKIMWI